MKMLLQREEYTSESTVGTLFVDGQQECFTLEDVVRAGPKVMHETAIPTGTYEVIIAYSNRFKKNLPRLVNVPGFEGILIHPGNTKEDTSGCILVGKSRRVDFVGSSVLAFNTLYAKIADACSRLEPVSITVQ